MGLLGRVSRALTGPSIEEMAESPLLKRDIGEPLEGTKMSLFQSQIPNFWAQNGLLPGQQWILGDGRLAEQVWVTNRCIQLNAQQIASMPLKYEAPSVSADGQPAWLSSPDPEYFPNGISDALAAVVRDYYGWGFSCQYVTAYYSDGYPRNWTVLPASAMKIFTRDGQRVYKLGEKELDPARIIQIDRDPSAGRVHGCSALESYAQQAWALLAAGNTSMSVSQGSMPRVWLASKRKIDSTQAADMQTQWMTAASNRNGAPPVIDENAVEPKELSFNPSDLALLDTQKWNAEVLCTAFGVPSVLLNMALQGGLTYQNPAALGEMWWRFELRPTGKRIMDAWTSRMLPAGQWVWLDAADTFMPLDQTSEEDDPQAGATANASPGPKPNTPPRLAAIGGTG